MSDWKPGDPIFEHGDFDEIGYFGGYWSATPITPDELPKEGE